MRCNPARFFSQTPQGRGGVILAVGKKGGLELLPSQPVNLPSTRCFNSGYNNACGACNIDARSKADHCSTFGKWDNPRNSHNSCAESNRIPDVHNSCTRMRGSRSRLPQVQFQPKPERQPVSSVR